MKITVVKPVQRAEDQLAPEGGDDLSFCLFCCNCACAQADGSITAAAHDGSQDSRDRLRPPLS
jgi:hypothetical protein